MRSSSLLTLVLPPAAAKIEIDAMKHHVAVITQGSFATQIGKFRDNSVASVMYYRESEDPEEFFKEYDDTAESMKGMVKMVAMNCESFGVTCKNEWLAAKQTGDYKTPFIIVYPVNPWPAYKFEPKDGKLVSASLKKDLGRKIQDNSSMLDDDKYKEWITTDRSKPKVVLFSEKETVAVLFKALSSELVFKRTVAFGVCPKSKCPNTAAKENKNAKYPLIIMKRGDAAEISEVYKGEMNFEGIYTWINLFSESGMGDQVHSAGEKNKAPIEESKFWLAEDIPELTAKSHQDVCFRGGDGLCVIYCKEQGPITDEEVKMLTGLKAKFTSNVSDRGARWKWMWIDLSVEKNYKELFGLKEHPGVVVFNPHKRLRWTKTEEDSEAPATEPVIQALLDKILGGDARFTPVKGQKLPLWTIREEPKKPKDKEEL